MSEHWKVGANTAEFANYSGFMQLNMKSPNQGSDKIAFTLHCH